MNRRIPPSPTLAPSLDDIARIAEAAMAAIPPSLARHIEGLAIGVEDLCDRETEQEMGLESPYELLGLYHGRPIGEKSVMDVVQDVDRISLYRLPILEYWCETGEDLERIVRHVMIHEIGHHFGLSDGDMESLESEADTNREDFV